MRHGSYGGVRRPSETLALRWADVDWDVGCMLVRSCKTEAHEGGESRYCPLFPELVPYLREAFEQASEGAVFVVPCFRTDEVNMRSQLLRILDRAKVKPWLRLFHNLRASR